MGQAQAQQAPQAAQDGHHTHEEEVGLEYDFEHSMRQGARSTLSELLDHLAQSEIAVAKADLDDPAGV